MNKLRIKLNTPQRLIFIKKIKIRHINARQASNKSKNEDEGEKKQVA